MYNNIIQTPSFYKVGLYIRLSEADDKKYESESESITNQRSLLIDYVKENRFTLIDEYIDDGYSGTNFDRPSFKRLLEDIDAGKINCVITKDLSRLGRNYVYCGYYMDEYFMQKKVRYIAILDSVDTFLESANNDFAPFKSLFNEMSSKDTSKKIRSIFKNKKEQGIFIGSAPSYGYMRDPLDKGHLIPDPETSGIVKKIFEMAYDGSNVSKISEYLNNKGYMTPSALKEKNGLGNHRCNNRWTVHSVNKILTNRIYTGDMVQNKQSKASYKSKRKITLNKSQWIIVENTHEPLISKEIFEEIQSSPRRTKITFKNRKKRVLENLLVCKECGNSLSIACRKGYWSINCNKYSREPSKRLCEPHFMPYDNLEEDILDTIKSTYKKNLEEINIYELAKDISDENNKKNIFESENDRLTKEIDNLQRKIDELYEDKFNNIITIDTYLRLSAPLEKQLKVTIEKLEQLQKDKEKPLETSQIEDYISSIKELINIENPTRELLKIIIDKIVIDKDKNINIVYKFKLNNL